MPTLQIRDFPDDLKRRLDVERAYAQRSIREVVIEAVTEKVDRMERDRERREARERREPRP